VTDTVTGLVWLKDSACLAGDHWRLANQAAAALADGQCGLTDGSSAGDWRLPTREEWAATIDRGTDLGCTLSNGNAPTLTDEDGFACVSLSVPWFEGSAQDAFWSSSTEPINPMDAAYADLVHGGVFYLSKGFIFRTWPVRSDR
jgi:hypothetical protein